MYTLEKYNGCKRFNEQYSEIYQFLLKAADRGYNEHFHWGRFEWMMEHTYLEEDKLTTIGIFRNELSEIVGLATFDTVYNDRSYIIHSISDKALLRQMVSYVIRDNEKTVVKANSKDTELCEVLWEYQFRKEHKEENVLQIELKDNLHYNVPEGYIISGEDFQLDNWKYQMVIHKGFDHEDIPEMWDSSFFELKPNANGSLKVFAMNEEEYCAHCGVWYTQGDTAYIEPVVTIPQCRNLGLAKAVVYEAVTRAKGLGAKRAIVLSGQEFYFKIGFDISSDFWVWTLN